MIEPQQFRDLMAGVCAPVTVVTTMTPDIAQSAPEVPHGATVSSFASLSLNPPLVSVAFDRGSALLGQIQAAGRFGVNVLGQAQDELAVTFARRDTDRFAGAHWFTDHGLPRLADAPGWMVCELDRSIEAGDHLLLFGLVTAASSRPDLAPLVYAHRTFGTHSRFAERPRPSIADLIAACAH
jgi:flavin reductase (DIM6/NTAB) family NADH-FMN oxidoreductase RutF